MDKNCYFTNVKRLITEKCDDEAANAIKKTITKLLESELCSLDEFLCLIDLDNKQYWDRIADGIALYAVEDIKSGKIHPNELKPWQNCTNYPEKFNKIAIQKEWRELHSAIDAINRCISARFAC